jgi:hypothetical protein
MTTLPRLTHAEIRQALQAGTKDNVLTCPLCHDPHLKLWGVDKVTCFVGGCDTGAVCRRIREILKTGEAPPVAKIPAKKYEPPSGHLELVDYTREKNLYERPLNQWFRVSQGKHPYYDEVDCAVCFPYLNERGEEVTQQWRWSMQKNGRRYLVGKPTYLYGGLRLQHLEWMAANGRGVRDLFVAEGESNVHTGTQNGLPILGLPGVKNWQHEWAKLQCFQAAARIYFFLDMKDGKPEQVAEEGARKMAADFEPGKLLGIRLPEPFKDLSDLWLFHTTNALGGGVEGFMADLHEARMAATPIIPKTAVVEVCDAESEEAAKIPDMSAEVLDGWLGDVVRERMKSFPVAFAWALRQSRETRRPFLVQKSLLHFH